jgi:DUF2075 family protein
MITDLMELTYNRGILLPDYRLLRRYHQVDAVLVTPTAVLVFGTDAAKTEAAAIDLADFHEGSRNTPIIPVILPETTAKRRRITAQRPLPFAGAAIPVLCSRLLLPGLLDTIEAFPPIPGFDPERWAEAPYSPVPALIDAACRLYANHDVAALLVTSSDRGDLARTREAVRAHLAAARAAAQKTIIFVTGAPGAGKTLCGLDLAFDPTFAATGPAVFLTGNPALVHVLRAALIRDAATRGLGRRAARQRVTAMVQPLHHFRDAHIRSPLPPAERILVIDEAQRCWTEAYAERKTRNRPNPLHASEPGLLLDTMARHDGFAAIVCLLGGGQEIHAGEGGLAAWGQALATRPQWHAAAPPEILTTKDPRQRLDTATLRKTDPALRLGAPVRTWRAPRLVAWIDAVLANDAATARSLAEPGLPIRLTRSLPAMLAALRQHRSQHGPGRIPSRIGILASTGARRLRAEGIGGMLWHQDEDAVASWFLETWPDIRSSDALELAATEFGVQGLELDHTGVCWDTDLLRTHDGTSWQARAFRATAWTIPSAPETLSNRLNAYRVLLTRARRSVIIWIPRGDRTDDTRDPTRYDTIAFFLQSCGAALLDTTAFLPEDRTMTSPPLL